LSSPKWQADDSFGSGIGLSLAYYVVTPLEVLMFLFFFVCSLATAIVLLKRGRLSNGIVFAWLALIPAIVSCLVVWNRGDLAWTAFPGAEVLLGLVTIIALSIKVADQSRLRTAQGGPANGCTSSRLS
jgi:hypothetical protein